jgi:predicted permease
MLRSFQALRSVDLGVDPSDVLVVGLSLGEAVEDRAGAAFYQAVADAVTVLPSVESVGLASMVPVGGGSFNGGSLHIESRPQPDDALPSVAMYKAIGADYMAAMRQPILAGRALERRDWEAGLPVALVNQTFANRFLDGDALGDGIKWDEGADFARIVGVVGDVREQGLTAEIGAWAYLPMVVGAWGYPNMEHMELVVRSRPGQVVAPAAVREIVARLDPNVPLTRVRSMDDVVAGDMAETSFTVVLLVIAAGVALFLGAVGLFGVVSYVVGRRTKEIGVRVALGAASVDVRAMVLRQGARVAAVGVGLGLVAALALTRLMGALLYGVGARDPVTFIGGPVVLVLVALVATWVPASRAARVDPVVALRAD